MGLRVPVFSFKHDCGYIGLVVLSPSFCIVSFGILFQKKVNIRYSYVLLFVADATKEIEGNSFTAVASLVAEHRL